MRTLIIILLNFFLGANAGVTSETKYPEMDLASPAPDTIVAKDSLTGQQLRDSIVLYAKSFLGKPYKYGCASSSGFDCSGFTWYVFSHFGYSVPRSSKEYKSFGTEVAVADARKGDVIVFRGTHAGDERSGHVGIVISNPGEPLQFIHSSSSKNHCGVVITDYINSHYPNRFIRICRVLR